MIDFRRSNNETPLPIGLKVNRMAVLEELAGSLTPSLLPDLAPAAELLAEDFAGWRRIAADPAAGQHHGPRDQRSAA